VGIGGSYSVNKMAECLGI